MTGPRSRSKLPASFWRKHGLLVVKIPCCQESRTGEQILALGLFFKVVGSHVWILGPFYWFSPKASALGCWAVSLVHCSSGVILPLGDLFPGTLLLMNRLGCGWKRILYILESFSANTGWHFLSPATTAQRRWHVSDGDVSHLAGLPWLAAPVVPVLSCHLSAAHFGGHSRPHRRGGALHNCRAQMPDAGMCFSSSSDGSGRSSEGLLEFTPFLASSQTSLLALLQNSCLRGQADNLLAALLDAIVF